MALRSVYIISLLGLLVLWQGGTAYAFSLERLALDTIPGGIPPRDTLPQEDPIPEITDYEIAVPQDSVEAAQAAKDTEEVSTYNPKTQGLFIGIDVGKLTSFVLPFELKYEGFIGYQYKKSFLFSVEAGSGDLTPNAYRNGQYQSQGIYWRAGPDYLISVNPRNSVYFGFRYAQSSFRDEGTFTVSSDLWPDVEESYSRDALSAVWGELVLGSEANVNDHLRFGWKFRVRFMFDFSEVDTFEIFAIPGYGRTVDKSIPALNLYLRYIF